MLTFSYLTLKGYKFTWRNNLEVGNVHERIDCAIANVKWHLSFASMDVTPLPAVDSDHFPLCANLLLEQEEKKE